MGSKEIDIAITNNKIIMEEVHGSKNAMITLGASSLGFISELKAAYGDYITVIYLFEDIRTVEESVEKYGAFSKNEKLTRIEANKKMQKLYLDNNNVFDEIVIYTGEKTCFDLKGLEEQFDAVVKKRKELEKKLNDKKYVSLPYNGSEPYIFISYAHDDRSVVYNALCSLQRNSFRIWYDDGIPWVVIEKND